MPIDSLLTKIKQPKEPTPNYYFALYLGQETVHSAVWYSLNSQTKIKSFGSVEEYRNDEEIVKAADGSLAASLEDITNEPNEVILGLPDSWVEDDQISSGKKPLIKELTEKLSLKPIGFVSITEAIIFFLKQKEGTPLSAIILELTSTEVTVSLVKLGKSTGSHTVGRSEDLGADVEEGLARFDPKEALPSRMILYNGHLDLESARQTLLSYTWKEHLPFLHTPKIELLNKDIPIRAVTVAATSEITSQTQTKTKPSPSQPQPEDLGFYKDVDILDKPAKPKTVSTKHPPQQVSQTQSTVSEEAPQRIKETRSPKIPGQLPLKQILIKSKEKLKKISSWFKNKKLPPLALIWLISLLVITTGTVLAYLLLPKADITIYLNPEIIKKSVDFTVSANKETDLEKARLHGEPISIEVEDKLQKDTSGEGLIGDKATGKVDIFNKTSSTKKFTSDTVLIGPSELKFTIDEDISIASQSASDTGITFGKATVAATAVAVGSESNLAAGTTLTVKGFDSSDYSAKVSSAFEGGSSKQVRSVSQEDKDALLEELEETLSKRALEDLSADLSSGQTIIQSSSLHEIINQEFNHAVGEEAESLKLNMKLKLTTFIIKSEDVLLLAQEDIKKKMPTGFITVEEATEINIQDAILDDNEAEIEADLTTKLIPELNSQEILNHIKGKYPAETESYFKSLPRFSRVDIELSPKLPPPLATFPRRSQNINLTVKQESQ